MQCGQRERVALKDRSDSPRGESPEAHLAEIIAMALIEKGIIDHDDLCIQLESMASARRDEGANDEVTAGLVRLAVSLRAVKRS